MNTDELDEIPEDIKELITNWLKTQGGLRNLFKSPPDGTDDQELGKLVKRMSSGDDLLRPFQGISRLQNEVIATYLLAEAYNPRSYAHLCKDSERSFNYYATIANVINTPEVWVRMGQMQWGAGNYKDAYHAFDAATEGPMKLTIGINVKDTAHRWLQNQAFLESAAAQERNDFRAAKMLERYIYRLDGSLRKSEAFDEAQYHLKKIRDGATPDTKFELQVFGGVELLKDNPNEQSIFIREFAANLSALEIADLLPGNNSTKDVLKNSLKRDSQILAQLNKFNQCCESSHFIDTAKRILSTSKEVLKTEKSVVPFDRTQKLTHH